jgi:protein SCO1
VNTMVVTQTLALVVGLALVSGGCRRGDDAPEERGGQSHRVADPGALADGESIFGLDLALVDQDGRALTLADLGGETMLAAMVYTSCTSVCIMVAEQMKAIEQQLAGVDDDVRYVLFSLDPGRDTPEALRAFARAHKLEGSRWRLMAASEDGVRDLAAVLGVKYQQEPTGEIAHSAMIFVIDGQGVVRHRQVGVGKGARDLVAALTAPGRTPSPNRTFP